MQKGIEVKKIIIFLFIVSLNVHAGNYFVAREQPHDDRISLYKIDSCRICASCEIQKNKSYSSLPLEEIDRTSTVVQRFTMKIAYLTGIHPCNIGGKDGYYQADIQNIDKDCIIIFSCQQYKQLSMLPENVLSIALHTDDPIMLHAALSKNAEFNIKRFVNRTINLMYQKLDDNIQRRADHGDKLYFAIPNTLIYLIENNYLAGTEIDAFINMIQSVRQHHEEEIENVTEVIELQDSLEQLL